MLLLDAALAFVMLILMLSAGKESYAQRPDWTLLESWVRG
jgi:hypothetical protein